MVNHRDERRRLCDFRRDDEGFAVLLAVASGEGRKRTEA